MTDFNNKFIVVVNSGFEDGLTNLTNQCLWISIKDFLRMYLLTNITLKNLRDQSGLSEPHKNFI